MAKIRVELTSLQENRLETMERNGGSLEHVQTVVQDFFDQQKDDAWEGKAVFLPFQAQYFNADKRARILYVLVNDTEKVITGVTGSLLLQLPVENTQVAASQIDFPQEFVGEVQPYTAMMFFVDMPVKGLYQDQTFHLQTLRLYIKDIKFQFITTN